MQKAWQARTFVDFGKASRGQHLGSEGLGGLDLADCASVGFGAIWAGGFLPVEAAGGCKTVASAYFGGRGACSQYGPKTIVCVKTLNPRGDLYCFT